VNWRDQEAPPPNTPMVPGWVGDPTPLGGTVLVAVAAHEGNGRGGSAPRPPPGTENGRGEQGDTPSVPGNGSPDRDWWLPWFPPYTTLVESSAAPGDEGSWGLPPVDLNAATPVPVEPEAVVGHLTHELMMLFFVLSVAMATGALVAAVGVILTV
jgi:hypothetical protein